MSSRHLAPLTPGHGVVIVGTRSDWVARYDVVVLSTLAALPIAVLVGWLLARRRRRGRASARWAWCSALCEVGIAYGTLPWVWLTMLPGSGAGRVHGQLSLVPLRDLQTMPTYQVVGNLLVFAALGALGPVRFRALASLPRIVVLGAACSALIETAQYVLPLGRVASVDDVLLNTAGAGLAAVLTWPWWRRDRSTAAAPVGDTRATATAGPGPVVGAGR
ncbi:VanZ family protein [Nocardioides sp. BP30]|uniref:VanZ family protein n=1 Tax=Nocardioides sp. BP30 TaxID=3036374 RepID=UPI0024687625|nr:VanZ family protein [Nocardioides sp. BP30]WGL50975.1 VanZ family protein [Nocardioides sp. BP30]